MNVYKTAESVSPKHPDKICDQISDAILDSYLKFDPNARVAVETAGGHGELFVVGEITSIIDIDIEPTIKRIAGDIKIRTNIVKQSPQIANGVDTGGAGDQGIMVGYACNETAELLPAEVILSRSLNKHLFRLWPYDGKTQITTKNGLISTIVASWQNIKSDELTKQIFIWLKHIDKNFTNGPVELHANPAGDWDLGGFDADTGLTGRKLVVDNYGPSIPIGGGCFSGKDATKVDRSAAYMARRIAVDNLRKHSAKEVYCYLAYAIGVSEPLEASLIIDGNYKKVSGYNLTPQGIINFLNLKSPIYENTAKWGHFGNNFPWDI